MPPKKSQKKAILPFPPATSAFKYNNGSFYKKDNPPQLNQIPIPIGANGCLNGISFVVTGTLPSLTRDQAKDLIEKYGGKLMSSISGKTDVVIRGVEEVGPKKIQEAQSRGILITDQEGLFTFLENSNRPASAAPAPAAAPAPPPPVQQQEKAQPSKKTQKGAAKKEKDTSEEDRIAEILTNLPKPTSAFDYFQGFTYGAKVGENPPRHNQIPIPVGKLGCLKGLIIVPTGTMPSVTTSELKDLIEKYGGTFSNSITKKTHILIRGCLDVGTSKMEKAKKQKIPIIDQEGFFKIIEDSNKQEQQQQTPQVSTQPSTEISTQFSTESYSSSLLSEKYRPRTLKDIVGNSAPINQLRSWVSNFKKTKKESKNDVKPIALISGPVGVGKTSAAHVVCSVEGFSVIEFNSSNSRTKKFIEELIQPTSNFSFDQEDPKIFSTKRNALIFEDIEDMSRSYSDLIELAKKSKNPIICICNNIDDKKFETLTKNSLSIRFSLPKAEEIKKRLRFICDNEGIDGITDDNLNDIILESKNDVRFAINNLQYWRQWNEKAKEYSHKDEEIIDIIDAAIKILTPSSQINLDKKFEAFFYDYGQIPLYIEQNLPLPMEPDKKATKKDRHDYADALESICYGDVIDNCIHENQAYSLLNAYAVTSSIYPSECVEASVPSLILPKLYVASKKQQKHQRYIQEIGERTITYSMQPKAEIYDTFSSLLNLKANSLAENKEKLISLVDDFGLSPDDLVNIGELTSFKDKKKSGGKLDSAMKDIMKLYKKKHSDDSKKVSSETDFRALHNFWQSVPPKTKK